MGGTRRHVAALSNAAAAAVRWPVPPTSDVPASRPSSLVGPGCSTGSTRRGALPPSPRGMESTPTFSVNASNGAGTAQAPFRLPPPFVPVHAPPTSLPAPPRTRALPLAQLGECPQPPSASAVPTASPSPRAAAMSVTRTVLPTADATRGDAGRGCRTGGSRDSGTCSDSERQRRSGGRPPHPWAASGLAPCRQ